MVRQFLATKDSDQTVAEVLGSNNLQHPHLARRSNNKRSRDIAGFHLKSTLAAAFIKDVFEDFSEFLSETLTKAAMKGIDPARFIGNVKFDIDAASILRAGNWDAVVKLISDALFRKLENERNTKDLIEKASVRIDLQIDNAILLAAMPYLDARHMLVHRDGKADEKYRRDYPNIKLYRDNKIKVTFPFLSAAKSTVLALALHIDNRIISSNLVSGNGYGVLCIIQEFLILQKALFRKRLTMKSRHLHENKSLVYVDLYSTIR